MGTSPFHSWGDVRPAESLALRYDWRDAPLPPIPAGRTLLPYGLGRSYGDSCLNDGGAVLPTRGLDRFIAFDTETGVLRAESGISLEELLRVTVPRGWFLPVTPGTRHVTLGGAIANDVHGKNHHRAGTFGRFVRRFELLRSDGARLECSPDDHADWFGATIGGLGLTGLVTWAELQLRRIESPRIVQETVKFGRLSEFFAINSESEPAFEYTVAWVDVLARGRGLGRGHYIRGNHAPAGVGALDEPRARQRLSVPFAAPELLLNGLTLGAFNAAYFHRQLRRESRRVVRLDSFFYPLDAIGHWNRLYGKRGFFQYQCVIPPADAPAVARELLDTIAASRQGSFLTVAKTFGALPSPGWLSFPRPGLTFALDFPNRGERTLALFDRLDRLVAAAGGSLYPAKDGRMSPADFQRAFPAWEKFRSYVDPRFSSDFWRRVSDGRRPAELSA